MTPRRRAARSLARSVETVEISGPFVRLLGEGTPVQRNGLMKKLGLLAMVLGIGGVLGVAAMTASAGGDPKPCHRTEFKTELVKNACTGADGAQKGSQPAAKEAMKKFLKDKKAKKPGLDCASCHVHLTPDYPLKPDALDTFKSLGGKLL